MALLNEDGYIRMLPYGEYEVYHTTEERQSFKTGHNYDSIMKSYEDLITSIESQVWTELDGQHRFGGEYPDMDTPIYDPIFKVNHPDVWNICSYLIHQKDEALAQRWNDASIERNRYNANVLNDSVSYEDFSKMSFPIMEQIRQDIHLSKIRPFVHGSFNLNIESVADVYEEVKKLRIFGNTEDV